MTNKIQNPKSKNSTFSHLKLIWHLSFGIWILTLVLMAPKADAAKLYFETNIQEISIGQRFPLDLILNTEDEEINAVEGKIGFPENLLELKEIRDGNSIINFWVEKPRIGSNNQVIFSGITPGGYVGENGLIFSVIFQAKNEGGGVIEISDAKTLLNDGKGTPAQLKISNFQFLISKQISTPQTPILEIKDTEPPEDFKPEIAQNPEMFDGKYFLVFATQDKGSGIDYYALRETRRKTIIRETDAKWIVAESPYVLKDQKLRSYIYVKAVDKAGNERIAMVEPRYPIRWYEIWWVWVIIIIIVAYIIWRKLKIKNEKRKIPI